MGIINRDGALWMATGVDNSGLYSGLNQAENRINQFEAHIGKVGDNITRLTGIGFGVAGLKAFGSEIVNVRGEIQMLESSFEVLLGGKGVSGFMSEMKQFAVDSPLSMNGVANAAQTLLGFGIEAEKVMPTIKQIGDISMGNEERFKSLSLAFAQMSATGKLMGQDLLQMINAGFNPLQVISEKTGKSIGELKKDMESGVISSEMVANAFASATEKGGKFYGMTQKQAEGIRGLQAQLDGGLQDAFNEIGKSQEGLITGGYKVATALVENYRLVGEALTALIATYGVYKAAMVFNTSIDKTVTVMRYEAEIAELTKLLPLKEQEANADLKAAVASGNLTQAKAEQLIALRAEVESRRESIQSKLAEEQANLKALYAKRAEAKETLEIARAKTAAAKEELANAIATAQADISSKQQKSLATAQETASLTRRNAILLNSQKIQLQSSMADTIAQAEIAKKNTLLLTQQQIQAQQAVADARELGIKGEKLAALRAEVTALNAKVTAAQREEKTTINSIATKRAEIVAIDQKLVSAKAEALSAQQNVIAKKAEIAAGTQSVTTKQIETLTNKVNTLSEQENAAATTHNGLIKQTVAGKVLIKKIATDADTASSQINTAVTNANTVSTNVLTAAKTRLITVAKNLWAVLAPNPYILAAAAAVALGYGIYKLATYTTEAEKSIKKFNEEAGNQIIELNGVFNAYKKANEGTEEKKKLLDIIKSKYGEYIKSLIDEKGRINDIEAAQRMANQALKESIALKIRNESITEITTKEVKKQADYLGDLRKIIAKSEGDEVANLMISKVGEIFTDESKTARGAALEAQKYLTDAGVGLDETSSLFGDSVGRILSNLQSSANSLKNEKKNIEDSFKGLIQGDPIDVYIPNRKSNDVPMYGAEYTKAKESWEKTKKELQKIEKDKNQFTKKQYEDAVSAEKKAKEDFEKLGGQTKVDKSGESKAKKAQELANDEAELRKKLANEALQAELDYEQAILDAKEESYDKQFLLNDLNYRKELQKIKEYNDQKLKEQADFITKFGKKALPEELTDKSIKEQVAKKTSQAQYNYEAVDGKTEKQRLEADKQAWNEYLKSFGDYEDKRLAIVEEYREKIGKAQTQGEKALLVGNRDKELQDLKKSMLNKSDLFVRLFSDSEDHTAKYIEDTIKQTQQLIDYLNKVEGVQIPIGLDEKDIEYLKSTEGAEKLKEIFKALKKQKEDLNTKNPFKNLIQGFNDLKKAGKDTEKKSSAINSISKSLSEIVTYANAASESISKLSDLGIFSKKDADNVKNIVGYLEGSVTASAGLGKVMSGDMSGIKDMISGTTSMIESAIGLFGSGKQLTQKQIDAYKNLLSVLDDVIARQKELLKNSSSGESAKYYQDALDTIEKQREAAKKFLSDDFFESKQNKTGRTYGARERRYIQQDDNQAKLKALGIELKNQYDLLNLTKDEILLIQQKMPEFYANLFDETKDYLQLIVDTEDKTKELGEALQETLTGISFDSLKDSLDNLVQDVNTTFEDIGDSFEDHMRKAVMNFVKSSYLTKALQDWYNKFAEYAQSGTTDDNFGLTPEEIAQLRKMYEDAYNKAQGMYDSALDAMGVSKENADINGIKGVAASITQDSANELNGNFYALRQSVNDVRNINKQTQEYIKIQTGHISDVKEAVNSYKQVFADQLTYIKMTAENTATTVSILREIRDNGLIMKR